MSASKKRPQVGLKCPHCGITVILEEPPPMFPGMDVFFLKSLTCPSCRKIIHNRDYVFADGYWMHIDKFKELHPNWKELRAEAFNKGIMGPNGEPYGKVESHLSDVKDPLAYMDELEKDFREKK